MTDVERQILMNQVVIMLVLKTLAPTPDWVDMLNQRANETNEKLRPSGRR